MNSNRRPLTGIRYFAFISCIVGAVGLTIYPIIISPLLNPEKYKEIQKINRSNIRQEEIQPGNMKVWTDPFDRKKSDDSLEDK